MGRAFGRVGVLAHERKGELQMGLSEQIILNRLERKLDDALALLQWLAKDSGMVPDTHGLTLRAPDRSAIELLRTIRNSGADFPEDFSQEFLDEMDAVLKQAGGR
jgi:hypothetical protein